MKALVVLGLFVVACAGPVAHCPPHMATVTLNCKEAVAQGKMTKEQCYQQIEDSCP